MNLTSSRRAVLFSLVLVMALVAACGDDAPPSPSDAGGVLDAGVNPNSDAGVADTGAADAAAPDAGAGDASSPDAGPSGYAHVPATGAVPDVLAGDRWKTHWVEDVRPFWMQDDALGTPPGNYPTFRGRSGRPAGRSERRPRMISRQIYAYAMGYLLTGEAALLERAGLGVRWLLDHAVDPRGGCHERLREDGSALEGPKYAQDTAYCALGMAAWFFVTRDPEAEAALLSLRDLLFDPSTFWDADAERIRDGRSPDLLSEVDQEQDGGWELVAQLDAINAFLLLAQPVLSEESRRAEALDDLRRLSDAMIRHFWQDGIFWGVSTKKGQYRTRHVDFGHTLKAYWMLLEVDKRLSDHPFQQWLDEHVDTWIARAHDGQRWMKRPTSATQNEGGSDWWIYAEAEQMAATRNLASGAYTDRLASSGQAWLDAYVDRQWNFEVFTGLTPQGQPVYQGPPNDTFKCNEWKNGYHSTEHALVMYLHGRHLEGLSAPLYFAVPEDTVETFVARPYYFRGSELERTTGSTVAAGGRTLRSVQVSFTDLY
ncbi:MAG: hypothetical protein AAFZ18_00570 [Myxococcota bacterium]